MCRKICCTCKVRHTTIISRHLERFSRYLDSHAHYGLLPAPSKVAPPISPKSLITRSNVKVARPTCFCPSACRLWRFVLSTLLPGLNSEAHAAFHPKLWHISCLVTLTLTFDLWPFDVEVLDIWYFVGANDHKVWKRVKICSPVSYSHFVSRL